MFSSHKVRLNRFLAADGRCLDVAIDHGVFNEHAFLDGLEDLPAVVRSLVEAGPDAIQMNIGQADVLLENFRPGVMKKLGLDWDAGPDREDERGPYRQSARAARYDAGFTTLEREGRAYPCWCTPEWWC